MEVTFVIVFLILWQMQSKERAPCEWVFRVLNEQNVPVLPKDETKRVHNMAKCCNDINLKCLVSSSFVGKTMCNRVQDGRVFLEAILEIHLWGNIALVKYQLMAWESCVLIMLMQSSFSSQALKNSMLQLCKFTVCVPWKLFSIEFPLLMMSHTTAFRPTYYNFQHTHCLK